MDCQTDWNPGGGLSSSCSPTSANIEVTHNPVIDGGHATAYSQPSQLDMRLLAAESPLQQSSDGIIFGEVAVNLMPKGEPTGIVGGPKLKAAAGELAAVVTADIEPPPPTVL